MKHTDEIYEFPMQLFRAHDCETPIEYTREAYNRTECGVSTAFLLDDGEVIYSADLTPTQNTPEWATRHIVGVQHGTIVEGSDAEFSADPLMFPFSDEELADAWQYLEDQVNSCQP